MNDLNIPKRKSKNESKPSFENSKPNILHTPFKLIYYMFILIKYDEQTMNIPLIIYQLKYF